MRLRKKIAVSTATLATALAGVLLVGPEATATLWDFRATLRDPSGRLVGTVEFDIGLRSTEVDAVLLPNRNVTPNQFHGFHVHANNDPANGQGCIADPNALRSTWFVSADGHLSDGVQKHGQHQGDLPSPLVMADGTARLSFTTDRIDPSKLRGKAVILHADPDNFSNVPIGSGPNQYTPGATAVDVTSRTGNAGDRVACGILQ